MTPAVQITGGPIICKGMGGDQLLSSPERGVKDAQAPAGSTKLMRGRIAPSLTITFVIQTGPFSSSSPLRCFHF